MRWYLMICVFSSLRADTQSRCLVMLPTDSLPPGSLPSSLLCPLPADKNDWWSPLLIYQIIDLLRHRFLMKLSLSKICSGRGGGTGLKHCFLWGVNLAFKFFSSIDFFCGKLVPYVQQNLADTYICGMGKKKSSFVVKNSPHNADSIMACGRD